MLDQTYWCSDGGDNIPGQQLQSVPELPQSGQQGGTEVGRMGKAKGKGCGFRVVRQAGQGEL